MSVVTPPGIAPGAISIPGTPPTGIAAAGAARSLPTNSSGFIAAIFPSYFWRGGTAIPAPAPIPPGAMPIIGSPAMPASMPGIAGPPGAIPGTPIPSAPGIPAWPPVGTPVKVRVGSPNNSVT